MRKTQQVIVILALVTALHAFCLTEATNWRTDYMKESTDCAASIVRSRLLDDPCQNKVEFKNSYRAWYVRYCDWLHSYLG